MGQIMQLAALSADYPATTGALDAAERLMLAGIRSWVADYRRGEDPLHRLCPVLDQAGVHDAAFSIDALMAVIGRTVRRPIAINCPRCPQVTEDERHLLHVVCLTQAGHSDRAERLLRNRLLSAIGAEFAVGPLEGLAKLFAEAGLLFSLRAATRGASDVQRVWTPPMAETLH